MTDINNKRCAFITGGTGGLGLATSRHLVAQGWHVFVADNNQEALDALANESNISPVYMDVTNRKSVEDAFSKVSQVTKKLEGLVNFAGILRIGSMAEMPEDTLKLVLEINVMGTYRVNQVFFPLLNGNTKGRIINISSETGWQSGAPFNGAYGMSKHAIEAYSDSLRRELALLNIPVIKVQPGPFKTNMVASIESNFSQAAETSSLFAQQLNRVKALAMNEQNKAHEPLLLAKVIENALTTKKPRAAYSVKPDKSRVFLEYLPTAFADWILKKVLNS